MLRINLLGGVDLLDADGGRCDARIGPKPLALLVYLLVEGRTRTVRRDIAAALLWPESRNARASLTQALYDLRTALGEHVFWTRGKEEIGVDVAHIESDCFEFVELAAAGSLEACVALHRGDFADGLFAKDAPGFDEWLAQQRHRWRAHVARVLRELYRIAVARDDLRAAAAWAQKLIDVAPTDDTPVRKLIPALIDTRQHAAAASLYDGYARKLRDLEVDPAADLAAMVEVIRQPRVEPEPEIQIGRSGWSKRRRVRVTATAGFVVTTAFVIGAVYKLRASSAEIDPSYLKHVAAPTIAISPFKHAESQILTRTSEVFTDALQWQLRDAGFAVISGDDHGHADAVIRLLRTRKSTSLAFVIDGAIEDAGNGIVATRVSVTEASTGNVLWSDEFSQSATNLHLTAAELSNSIAGRIRRIAGRVVEIVPTGVKPEPANWRELYHARERIEGAKQMRFAGATASSLTELRLADSSLATIAIAEPNWPLPWVLRARVAEGRAITALIAGGPTGTGGAIELERGILLLDSAIAALPHPDLFEQRGLLKYRRWLFGIENVSAAHRLLRSAEKDLRKALETNADRTVSYVALSGVLFGQGKFADAYIFARRAYETDVFLRQDEEILQRLFNSSFHAREDESAEDWCREIQNVVGKRWPAVMCKIHLAGYAPKLVPLEGLLEEIDALADPEPVRQLMKRRLLAAYAATLALNKMPDSAEVILKQTIGHEKDDPELLAFNAFALAALGRAPQANALLDLYFESNAGTRSAIKHARWLH